MLRDLALVKNNIFIWIQNQTRSGLRLLLPGVRREQFWIPLHGDGMQIDHTVDAIVIMLQHNPVFQG